mmetsp:Transcript_10810/g.22873  ORF Transcript_10810/g.22873 Transcript_10810/m.22873 type:complete len:418 (+) Transcript_10810:172-1425(+)
MMRTRLPLVQNERTLRYVVLSALFVSCFIAGISYGRNANADAGTEYSYGADGVRQLRNSEEREERMSSAAADSNLLAQQALLHAQCARATPSDQQQQQLAKNRPLLLLKYSRTGSTWLAWTGSTLRSSGKPMTWVSEAQGCIRDENGDKFDTPVLAEHLSNWFKEYFSKTTRGGVMNSRHAKHAKIIDNKCLETVGRDPSELGVMAATLNPHVDHPETPEITDEEWGEIFHENPDLAIAVLVRTNAVKRGVSAIASDTQKEICHSKKIHVGDECIKDLPKTVYVDPHALMGKIRESEMKRTIVTERAAELATTYGDGRIFCLSYEAMQEDLVGEMKDLGDFLNAPIDASSLAELEEDTLSYKRGSDDLSEYIENYQEIHDMFANDNPCLLEQLEATEPGMFRLCDVYQATDDVEDEE